MRGKVIGTVLVVGVVAGGAVVADGIARDRTEAQLAAELPEQIAGLDSEPEVTIDGVPFLTQVLAGELDDVHITAPSATLDGMVLEDIEVQLFGVSTSQPTTAQEATFTAFAPMSSLTAQAPADLDISVDAGNIVASTSFLGMAIQFTLEPTVAERSIDVQLVSLTIGGISVDAEDVPGGLADDILDMSFPVESLPQNMELTELTLTSEGAQLEAEGTDVVLDVEDLPE